MVSRGDVCRANLSVDGRRPVVVITRNEAIPRLTRILVVPVTRTIRGLPCEVVLGSEDGLGRESVANLDNVQVVELSRLDPPFARLGDWRMAQICRALGYVTGCEERAAA